MRGRVGDNDEGVGSVQWKEGEVGVVGMGGGCQ